MTHTPVLVKSGQRIYRFPNGYGASVINNQYSYGTELAVVTFASENPDDFDLVYDTPITEDVIGHMAEDEVQETLDAIEALPHRAQR